MSARKASNGDAALALRKVCLHRGAWVILLPLFAAFVSTAQAVEPSKSGGRQGRVRSGIDTRFGEVAQDGTRYLAEKKFARAAALFTEALRMKPDSKNAAMLRWKRGRAYAELHQYRAAGADWEAARAVFAGEEELLNDLAWLRATCPDPGARNGKAAIRDATRACALTNWQEATALDTLAAAYAEAGDFEQAVRIQTRAVEAAPFFRRNVYHQHLASFQQRKPVREE